MLAGEDYGPGQGGRSPKASTEETGDAAAAGQLGDPDSSFTKMFEHKGPYEAEKYGPAPDYSTPDHWFHYGGNGTDGAELVVDGMDKPPVEERLADCFYVHETTYFGDLWNQPISDKSLDPRTMYFLASGPSAFNGCCRMYVPRFRQSTLAGMVY